MTAVVGYLEPFEDSWTDTTPPRLRETGCTVRMPIEVPADAVGRLRTVAAMVWFGWLIATGLLVGSTALVVLARIAWVVLRWAVAL